MRCDAMLLLSTERVVSLNALFSIVSDDMIATRRKKETKEKTADRSIATGRAKRKAAQDAKRGISSSKKASTQQIQQEVKKQQVKTAKAKAKKQKEENKKGVTAKLPPKAKQEARKSQREINKIVKDAASITRGHKAIAAVPPHGKTPSKKAVNAAVKAMEKEGFVIPEGMQMVITFAPKEATKKAIEKAASTQQQHQQTTGSNQGKQGNRRGTRDRK